jgi:phenylacetaldehyde dehydrogenase
MLIGGRWLEAETGKTIDVYNPATDQVIAGVPAGGAEDVDKAVRAAREAFDRGPWRTMTPYDRSKVLWKIADLIDLHAEELAQLEVLDQGKPIAIARASVVPTAAEAFRFSAGWCNPEGKTHILSRPGRHHVYTRREPVGVVGQIIPWSSPLTQAAGKLAQALAAGCTIVLKPAEQTPLTALRLSELALEAGVPEGVLNVVTGYGATAGAAIARHPMIDKVAFTGSTATGAAIVMAAAGNLKRVSLELGGKSPTIILADADLPAAIAGASAAIFFNSGQTCAAGSRLFAHKSVFDQVVAGITERAKALRMGPGLDPSTQLGPLTSRGHRDRVVAMLEQGLGEGAEVLTGGKWSKTGGYFVDPTVLVNTHPAMRIMHEEIFGPVLTAMPVSDLEEIVALSNGTDFGLGASIWTRDFASAHNLAADIRSGMVWINCFGTMDFGVAFGGFKQSGWGREHGAEGMNLYLETKTVIAAL